MVSCNCQMALPSYSEQNTAPVSLVSCIVPVVICSLHVWYMQNIDLKEPVPVPVLSKNWLVPEELNFNQVIATYQRNHKCHRLMICTVNVEWHNKTLPVPVWGSLRHSSPLCWTIWNSSKRPSKASTTPWTLNGLGNLWHLIEVETENFVEVATNINEGEWR